MTEPGQPGIPPRIELDPHPEPSRPATPYQAPAANYPRPPLPAWDAPRTEPVPWEDERVIPGALDRLWATIRLGFTDPMELSARVPATDPILPSWLFFLITGVPTTILSLVLSEVTTQAMASLLHAPIHRNPGMQLGFATLGLLIGPFIGGAFLHLFLWMWGGAKEGLGIQQTIRFGCYAQGIYCLVGWIPILNIPLGIVFWIFLSMGLAKAHRTDTWRGFAATLTPVIACCCIGIGTAILIPGLLAARH